MQWCLCRINGATGGKFVVEYATVDITWELPPGCSLNASAAPATPSTSQVELPSVVDCTESNGGFPTQPTMRPAAIFTTCDSWVDVDPNSRVEVNQWTSSVSTRAMAAGTHYQEQNSGEYWGVDVELSSAQAVGGQQLFTKLTLTCDSSVPPVRAPLAAEG